MSLVLGIKYCGSCNVKFDRTALVTRIRSVLGDRLDIRYTSQGGSFDLILVLNACESACADLSGLTPRRGLFRVATAEDADPDGPVIPWIQSFLDRDAVSSDP